MSFTSGVRCATVEAVLSVCRRQCSARRHMRSWRNFGAQRRRMSSRIAARSGGVVFNDQIGAIKHRPRQYTSCGAQGSAVSGVDHRRGLLTDVLAAVAPGDHRTHVMEEERSICFPRDVVYAAIADVKNYSEFVPWCLESRVVRKAADGRRLEAVLAVGFRLFTERYTSVVTLDPPYSVKAVAKDTSVFRSLKNEWLVLDGPDAHTTKLLFRLEFAFQSSLYAGVTNMFFDEVVDQMVRAFTNRCAILHRHAQDPGLDDQVPFGSIDRYLAPRSPKRAATAPNGAERHFVGSSNAARALQRKRAVASRRTAALVTATSPPSSSRPHTRSRSPSAASRRPSRRGPAPPLPRRASLW